MAVVTVADLVQALRQSQLLAPGRLEEVVQRFADHCTEPRALARELLKRNWLTAYQINQVFQGQGGALVLGAYRVLQRLGEGGMGRVFKAWHQKLDRIVALKVLHPEYVARPDAVRRFHQEIQASAQLSHPNIVFAFDADQVGESHFLAMEYVQGIGLTRMVSQHGPLPPQQACDYVVQAARGLQHGYERGLVHRDVKPSNLLIARRQQNRAWVAGDRRSKQRARHGILKIIDFGLARLQPDGRHPDSTRRLTRVGTVMGTPDFIAPEQAADTSNADVRADLYSLGCTLYYALTSQVPFPGGTVADKLRSHESKEPVAVEKLSPEVPRELGDVVRRLMAKRPEDRYQTPAELAKQMEDFLRPDGLLARARQRPPSPAEVLPGFFEPGAGSLSSTTIVPEAIK